MGWGLLQRPLAGQLLIRGHTIRASRISPQGLAKQRLSSGAVAAQHGSAGRASGAWLAGRRETPPQHAPAARAGQG
jgi:hypothetical protein